MEVMSEARVCVPKDVLRDVEREVVRQDGLHPGGYATTRDGVRLGIAALEDEVREALDAWGSEKRAPSWQETYGEVEQTVAVGLRIMREMRLAGSSGR